MAPGRKIVGVAGILAGLADALSSLLAPALVIGWVIPVISWFVAAKEALDLDLVQAVLTVTLGWLVFGSIMMLGSAVLSLIGLTARGVGSIFGFLVCAWTGGTSQAAGPPTRIRKGKRVWARNTSGQRSIKSTVMSWSPK